MQTGKRFVKCSCTFEALPRSISGPVDSLENSALYPSSTFSPARPWGPVVMTRRSQYIIYLADSGCLAPRYPSAVSATWNLRASTGVDETGQAKRRGRPGRPDIAWKAGPQAGREAIHPWKASTEPPVCGPSPLLPASPPWSLSPLAAHMPARSGLSARMSAFHDQHCWPRRNQENGAGQEHARAGGAEGGRRQDYVVVSTGRRRTCPCAPLAAPEAVTRMTRSCSTMEELSLCSRVVSRQCTSAFGAWEGRAAMCIPLQHTTASSVGQACAWNYKQPEYDRARTTTTTRYPRLRSHPGRPLRCGQFRSQHCRGAGPNARLGQGARYESRGSRGERPT